MQRDARVMIMVFVSGICFGIGIGAVWSTISEKSEAVAHHAAHYDSQTGVWLWNDEVRP